MTHRATSLEQVPSLQAPVQHSELAAHPPPSTVQEHVPVVRSHRPVQHSPSCTQKDPAAVHALPDVESTPSLGINPPSTEDPPEPTKQCDNGKTKSAMGTTK
jgi:hypothetical protein